MAGETVSQMRKIFYLFLLSSLFLFTQNLAAQEELVSRVAQELSDSVMSPFCPGRTLAACPSEEARQLRLQIYDWVKNGDSPDTVKDKLVATYGVDVLGKPEAEGVGLLALGVPIAVFLIAVAGLFYAFKVMSRRRALGGSVAVEREVDLVLREKVDQEVKRRMI